MPQSPHRAIAEPAHHIVVRLVDDLGPDNVRAGLAIIDRIAEIYQPGLTGASVSVADRTAWEARRFIFGTLWPGA